MNIRKAPVHHKGNWVLGEIRRMILGRVFSPGERLPTFGEMEIQFGVSRAVLQVAMARIQADGFIRTEDRRGIFLETHPPHLFHYGIAFSSEPDTPEWTGFFDRVRRQFDRQVAAVPGARATRFWNLCERDARHATVEPLQQVLASGAMAGLLLMPGTHWLASLPWFQATQVPCVFLAAAFDAGCVPNVRTDREHLYSRTLDYFSSCGCGRVAVMDMADLVYRLDLPACFEASGVLFRPQWHQCVGRSNPECARGVARLLMDYPPGDRPDALLIADDNLVDGALAGLADAGVVPGRDLQVVGHCNWPIAHRLSNGIRGIGFDMDRLVATAMACAKKIGDGKTCPPEMLIPALFEDEVAF